MAAPRLPQQFGPYTLQELIARGGMAEIFRATMPGVGGFEKTVAIKKILPHLAENAEYMTMLIDEARIIVSINHANIAQVYDLGEIHGDYYIAMEYIHGIDLSTIVKELKEANRTLPVEHALFITSGIAAGLHVAHNKCDENGRPINIVHRDVSPHNILISFAGDVKIIDFGVAKARGKEAHTQLGVIKGKLLYMAPEQAMAKDLDGRADLFAMGLILYRMLTNHLPFEGDNEFQIYNNILSKEITPPRAFNPNIPEEVNQIVMMLLQRDPSKRYQDGYSAKVDLDRALQTVAPGYSISRLSRWVEDEFSHLIAQRRQAQSGQNEAIAPSTPSRNHVTTGDHAQPSWDSPDWDDIDEEEDTINVAMNSPEAQQVLERAMRERERYQDLRASGEIPAPAPAPWSTNGQQGPVPGQVPPAQQSGQWQQGNAPYGSGQYPSPYPAPYGSGQYPVPGYQQSGLFPTSQPPAYPVNQSGSFPVGNSGMFPVSHSGVYPVNQSGAYPVGQSGVYPLPPHQSGVFNAQSPHYQPFQGPSPADGSQPPAAGSDPAIATSGAGLRAKVVVLVILLITVGVLGFNLVTGGDDATPPEKSNTTPTPPQPTPEAAVEGGEQPPEPEQPPALPAAESTDAGVKQEAVRTGDLGADVRTVGLRIDTKPEGADVFVNGTLLGKSPIRDQIEWGEQEVTFRFVLDGYETKEMAAIPFDDVKRQVELRKIEVPEPEETADPEATPEPAEEPAAEKDEEKPKPKPKPKPRRRRPAPPKETTKPKDPSVPLLLDEPTEPKESPADVPVF